MKILITGGAGFCGSNLAFHLCQTHNVTVLDNLVRRGSELNIPKFKDYGIKFIHGDIRNIEDVMSMGKQDLILHCAAQPDACSGYIVPTHDISSNYTGVVNVLEYARLTKSKLIFWSTNKVYPYEAVNKCLTVPEGLSVDGGHHTIYGISKLCADLTCQEWAKAFDVPIIINRFSCLAGPGQFAKAEQGWVSWFVVAAIFNLPLTIYGFKGKQVRDVLFMPDICNLIDIEIKQINKYRGEVFNIGGGSPNAISLIGCIDLIESLISKKIKLTYDKTPRKSDQKCYISDISKAKRMLKWEPKIGIKEGLIDIIDWVNKNKEDLKCLYS